MRALVPVLLLSLSAVPARADDACVPLSGDPPARADGVHTVSVSGGVLSFCLGEARCWKLDLATGAYTAAGKPAPIGEDSYPPVLAPRADLPTVRADGTRLTVCGPGGTACKTFDIGGSDVIGQVAVNETQTIVAVERRPPDDSEDSTFTLETYSVPTHALLARKANKGEDSLICLGELAVLGDTVYVDRSVCAGPGDEGYLAKAKTLARIADVGGKRGGNTYGTVPVPLGKDVWAFSVDYGAALVLQNVKTGRVQKRIDLRKLFPKDETGPSIEPGNHVVLAPGDGTVVLALGPPSSGDVVIVDAKRAKVRTRFVPPICK